MATTAEETTTYVPGNTKDAHFAVMYHVALKGVQAGSLLGVAMLAPGMWLLVGRKTGRSFLSYVRSEASIGASMCCPLALAAGWHKLKDATPESIADRAYRIKHNERQQNIDKFSFFGGAIGGGVGAIGFGVNPVLGFAQGGSLGFGLGVLVFVAVSAWQQQSKAKD